MKKKKKGERRRGWQNFLFLNINIQLKTCGILRKIPIIEYVEKEYCSHFIRKEGKK